MLDVNTTNTQICEHINNMSLVSLGKLCNRCCEAMVTKKMCTACKDKDPIIKAPICTTTGMHIMDMTNPAQNVKMKNDIAMASTSVAQRQSKWSKHPKLHIIRAIKFLPFITRRHIITNS